MIEESYRGDRNIAMRMMEMNLEMQPDDTTTIYVLGLLYGYSARSEECIELAKRGLHIVSEKRESGVHYLRDNFARDEANMITVYAMCVPNASLRGKLLYKAIEIDPSNTFAIERAKELLSMASKMGILPTNEDMMRQAAQGNL